MMDPVRTYDYLVLARKKIFDWIRPLTAEQFSREFAIGPGSLAKTLIHVLLGEWYYVQRMLKRELPPYDQWPFQDEKPLPFGDLESAWSKQATETRAALATQRDWNTEFEYRVTGDDGKPYLVTTSASDIATQLVLHEVHHRAQVTNMLRHLSVKLEDIDFNALMYKRRPISE